MKQVSWLYSRNTNAPLNYSGIQDTDCKIRAMYLNKIYKIYQFGP